MRRSVSEFLAERLPVPFQLHDAPSSQTLYVTLPLFPLLSTFEALSLRVYFRCHDEFHALRFFHAAVSTSASACAFAGRSPGRPAEGHPRHATAPAGLSLLLVCTICMLCTIQAFIPFSYHFMPGTRVPRCQYAILNVCPPCMCHLPCLLNSPVTKPVRNL